MAIRSLKASNLNLEAKGFKGQQQTGIFIRGADAITENSLGFWQRNSKWLTLPTVTASEQKIVGLFAVTRHFPHATVLVSGNYTVDWGDGSSSVNYTANFQAHKRYIYDDLSNSTLIQDPILGDYKQVIVTITAQAGQNLTSVNFHVFPGYTLGYSSRPPNNWLELVIAGPNITTLLIGSQNSVSATAQQNFPFLEQITILSNNLTTGGRFLFSNLNALQSVPILNTTTWTSFQGVFQNCKRLKYVCRLDGRRATSAANMFDGCSALVEAPIIDFVSSNTATTSSCTNMSSMFQNCSNLQNVPYYDTAGVSTFQSMFLGCASLKRVPDYDFSFQNGGSGISLNGMFSACYSLEELPNSNTVFVNDMASYASQCTNLRKVPYYNYSNVTTLQFAYNACYNIKEFPDFDTTFKCTTFNSIHNANYSLTKVGKYEVANGLTFSSAWAGCRNLVYPPVFTFNGQPDIVPKITDYSYMFNGCSALLYGPKIDTDNVRTRTSGTQPSVSVIQMFNDCVSLRKIGPYNFNATGTYSDFAFTATYLTDMDISFPDYGVATATLGTHGSNYFFPTGAARGGVSNLVIRHINTSFSVACTSIGMDCINDLFRNLGKGAGTQTITVSQTFVSNTQFGQTTTTNFDRANGSNALYGGSTTGILVGQSVTGGNLGYLRFQICFADGPNNTITLENHGMPANSNIYPPVLISRGVQRFAADPGQVSNTRIHPSGNTLPRQWMTLRRANGIFMTVAAKSNVSAWSTDGYTWNNSYLPAEQVWVEVAYGANTWVAIANRKGVSDLSTETTNAAAYSTDNGVTWNHCNLPANANWVSVAYGNGVFVAIRGGIYGSTHSDTATSTNGINWTARPNAFGTALQSNTVKWVNDRFYVLTGTSTTRTFNYYSFDGITWFQATFPSGYWKDISYSDGVYFAMSGGGFSSTQAAISVDGHNWVTATSPFSTPWSRVEWAGGECVMLGQSSTNGRYVANNSHFAARAGWAITSVLPNNDSGSSQYWQGLAYDDTTARFVMLAGGNYALSGAGQVIAYLTSATSNSVAHMNLCPQVVSLSKGYNGTVFYARDITENTFKLSVTKGGPVWNIGNASANGCSSNTAQFIRIGTVVKEVTNSTQVILSSPSFTSGSLVSTTFKANADYVIAAMKGWTVLG